MPYTTVLRKITAYTYTFLNCTSSLLNHPSLSRLVFTRSQDEYLSHLLSHPTSLAHRLAVIREVR